jgi:hypothetical protein
MRFRSFTLAACLVLVTTAGTAAAQNRAGTFELSPFAGGYFGGTLVDSGHDHLEVGTDWAYGGRLAYNVNRYFGIEFDWTHARADLESNRFSGTGIVGTFTQDVYEANAIFNFGKRRAVGYFGIGAGAAVMKTAFNGGTSTSETRFTGNMSLGFKVYVTPRFGFRIDGRFRYTDTNHTTNRDSYCDYYGYCYSYHTTWYYSGELTGGLIFAF